MKEQMRGADRRIVWIILVKSLVQGLSPARA